MVNLGSRRLRVGVMGACAGGALALPLLGGCGQRSAASPADDLPAGSFRVLVTKLVSDPSVTVTQITVEKSGAGQINVQGHGFGYGASLAPGPQKDSALARANTVVVADLVTANRPDKTLKVFMQTSSSTSGGNYSGTFPAVSAAQVGGVFALTLRSGVYPVGTPLRLATLQGRPVTLTIK